MGSGNRGILTVNPLIAGRTHLSQDVGSLAGVDGSALAEVRLAPRLLARLALNEVRASADGVAPGAELFVRAADAFEHGDVLGESPRHYLERVALAAGLPISVARAGLRDIAGSMRDIRRINERDFPAATVVPGGRVELTPAGRVFASVVAMGKHQEPNEVWLRALSLGYSVLVRPGLRDPFTARRLAGALLGAGMPKHKVTLLPGDEGMARMLVREADRSVMFGPEEKVSSWRALRNVQVHGDGRSKVFIDHEPSAGELEFLAESVAGKAGVRCDCASVILTTGDPAALADSLAELLAERRAEVVTSDAAQVPVVPARAAERLRVRYAELGAGMTDHSSPGYGGGPLLELPDGSFAVRPVVLSTSDPSHPAVGTEMDYPFVTVARWRPVDGVVPLTRSLFLTFLAEDEGLLAAAAADPTVGEVIAGAAPPWARHFWLPEPPLTRLLMAEKRILTFEAPA
ncbi:acyl-CoA reductase-like NAD-dependent aldehyde dehydrogenase [Saccharopolyspora erythraea NRRL 2338]|uniref:Acyl-CoA reductase-like NAD-dependent aldehyde dehydrogenase n=1 Tax=Saccharopolyspora erythraea TaxID=1836 RepID=A0ABN1D8N6_SACER|nr:phenazine biosynthesis protein [Saccharopolyspora erythraea]EQD82708.1 phenazine biosynthesis protein [Saccharopolyspora erythraea D]PFG97082.1 acyl-CoA reductase-like NAD-dependent aldehyde dehydrogenase [Saccharopolyspora erythraea NRRL 2338]QRK87292.1 phenazine biosynthesis protein [Saccharopolyspora erythraea]